MILAVVGLLGREQQDLRVDELQHLFELVLVPHPDHALEAARLRGVDDLAERVTVLGDVDHERVDVSGLARATEREQRQVACSPAGRRRGRRTTRPSAPCSSRRARTRAVGDLDEHGDPVAFCDRLAQPPCTRHGS